MDIGGGTDVGARRTSGRGGRPSPRRSGADVVRHRRRHHPAGAPGGARPLGSPLRAPLLRARRLRRRGAGRLAPPRLGGRPSGRPGYRAGLPVRPGRRAAAALRARRRLAGRGDLRWADVRRRRHGRERRPSTPPSPSRSSPRRTRPGSASAASCPSAPARPRRRGSCSGRAKTSASGSTSPSTRLGSGPPSPSRTRPARRGRSRRGRPTGTDYRLAIEPPLGPGEAVRVRVAGEAVSQPDTTFSQTFRRVTERELGTLSGTVAGAARHERRRRRGALRRRRGRRLDRVRPLRRRPSGRRRAVPLRKAARRPLPVSGRSWTAMATGGGTAAGSARTAGPSRSRGPTRPAWRARWDSAPRRRPALAGGRLRGRLARGVLGRTCIAGAGNRLCHNWRLVPTWLVRIHSMCTYACKALPPRPFPHPAPLHHATTASDPPNSSPGGFSLRSCSPPSYGPPRAPALAQDFSGLCDGSGDAFVVQGDERQATTGLFELFQRGDALTLDRLGTIEADVNALVFYEDYPLRQRAGHVRPRPDRQRRRYR